MKSQTKNKLMKFVYSPKLLLHFSLFILCLGNLNAQNNVWTKTNTNSFELNATALNNILSQVSKEKNTSAVVNFPNGDGNLVPYNLVDNSLLPKNLALKYPNVHAYKGICTDNSNLSITLTCTPNGIAGTIINGPNIWSLQQLENTHTYKIIDDTQIIGTRINCGVNEFNSSSSHNHSANLTSSATSSEKTLASDNTLRVLRMAITVTGEYSNYFINKAQVGSSDENTQKATVLAGIVSSLNNINTVFERDLGIRFELVENNDDLIFLNENTDPFFTDDANDLIDTGNAQIVNIIGLNNFDIGHVLSIGFAGLAEVRALCSSRKGQAVSAGPIPEGTEFNFTLLAHEIGHQLGANHTQNSNCERNNATAVEPGAASTIMGYAGVPSCATFEIQPISDEYFHIVSINQITDHVQSVSCNIETQTVSNTLPVIEPLLNYAIPANTNFILEATATDLDNDSLTYSWEQTDNEIATMPPVATSTGGPLFRSLPPSSNPSRNFPEEYNVITTWEVLPTVSREMNFGLTVRDGNPGGIVSTSTTVSVVDTGNQFSVTEPSSGSRYTQNSVQNITWNVAGTDSNGINTEFVKIELSYDNGLTFNNILSESTPNDGEELLVIPVGRATDDAKIRITAIDNIYYTISESPFVITEDIADDLAPIPNPISDNILIQIFKLQVPQYQFTLHDLNGKLLISKTLTSDTLVPEIEVVDISNLNEGMYILKIILGSQIHTRKIIKL